MIAEAAPGPALLIPRFSLPAALLLLLGGVAAICAWIGAPGIYEQVVAGSLLMALAWIAAIDSQTLRAPNRLVYPLAAAATAAPFALSLAQGIDAAAGGFLSLVILLVVVFAGRGAMGFADAKVAYICGALVGLSGVLYLILVTFATGGAFAAAMLGLRLRNRKDAVAFTPFLLLGVLVVALSSSGDTYAIGGR